MLAGAIIGGIGALGKTISGFNQMKMANKIKPEWAKYEENKLAGQNLGATQNLFYGKNRAFTQAEANIRQAQSDQMANAQRNATDSATLLATGAGAAGNANQAFSNLAGQEAQQQAGILDNLSRAYGMSIAEGDKVQANKLMKYQLDSQAQAALRESGMNNIFGGVSDIGGGLMQYGNYKNAANFNKMLGGMGGAQGAQLMGGGAQGGMGALNSMVNAGNNSYADEVLGTGDYSKYAGMEQKMPQVYGGNVLPNVQKGYYGFAKPYTAEYSAPREFRGKMPNISPNYRGIPMASAGTTGIPYIPSWGR